MTVFELLTVAMPTTKSSWMFYASNGKYSPTVSKHRSAFGTSVITCHCHIVASHETWILKVP